MTNHVKKIILRPSLPKMQESEQVISHDSEFAPKRTILLPIDHSKITTNTVKYVIENIASKKEQELPD